MKNRRKRKQEEEDKLEEEAKERVVVMRVVVKEVEEEGRRRRRYMPHGLFDGDIGRVVVHRNLLRCSVHCEGLEGKREEYEEDGGKKRGSQR